MACMNNILKSVNHWLICTKTSCTGDNDNLQNYNKFHFASSLCYQLKLQQICIWKMHECLNVVCGLDAAVPVIECNIDVAIF